MLIKKHWQHQKSMKPRLTTWAAPHTEVTRMHKEANTEEEEETHSFQ